MAYAQRSRLRQGYGGQAGDSSPAKLAERERPDKRRRVEPIFYKRLYSNGVLLGQNGIKQPRKHKTYEAVLCSNEIENYLPQHFLNFLPEPQGHGSLRPMSAVFSCSGVIVTPAIVSCPPTKFSSLSSWSRRCSIAC